MSSSLKMMMKKKTKRGRKPWKTIVEGGETPVKLKKLMEENGKRKEEVNEGDLVFAKVPGHPPWPSTVSGYYDHFLLLVSLQFFLRVIQKEKIIVFIDMISGEECDVADDSQAVFGRFLRH